MMLAPHHAIDKIISLFIVGGWIFVIDLTTPIVLFSRECVSVTKIIVYMPGEFGFFMFTAAAPIVLLLAAGIVFVVYVLFRGCIRGWRQGWDDLRASNTPHTQQKSSSV